MSNPAPYGPTAAVAALQTYLAAAITGLTVRDEWPNANQKLIFPSVTLTAGKVTTMNRAPEQMSVTTPVANQVTATECIGEHDFKLQVDLWTRTKIERDTILGQILNALSPIPVGNGGANRCAGLSLQLSNYYNDWVRFDVDGHELVDDEAAAQRQERRARIDLLVNCRAIQLRTYYAMVSIQTNVGASSNDSDMQDNTTNTDQSTVPAG